MRTSSGLWVACIAALVTISHSADAQTPTAKPSPPASGRLRITVALVDDQLAVRPVPLHGLRIISPSSDTVDARTGTDGIAQLELAIGSYEIESLSPVAFHARHYRWSLGCSVKASAVTDVSLSNDNAIQTDAPTSRTMSGTVGQPSTSELFQRLRGSVYKVEAGLAHGTGFLADTLGGVILTNSHVVEAADLSTLSVEMDGELRVPGQLLARDEAADIAVLRVHPSIVTGRIRIPLQNPQGSHPVVPGEQLVAMGYPLHQELTITSGIASSIRAGAIISDVNINQGNSGGPLLNATGEAVAVNTFGDVADRGAGVSGSVLVGRAGPALAAAAAAMQQLPEVAADSLPMLPSERMNLTSLKVYADTVNALQYDGFVGIGVGGFDVALQTPAQMFVAIKEYEHEIGKDRKKREARAKLAEEERYSEVRQYRDWTEYVGVSSTPVVSISVVPRVAETGGSIVARMFSANMQATLKFQGDVRGVRVLRNGEPVVPIRGGHAPTRVYVSDRWVSLKDVADQGCYVFDAELLRPNDAGIAPSIVIAIHDLKSPKKLKCRELPGPVVARAWNDFEPFYREARPHVPFTRADIKLSSKQRERVAPAELSQQCTWYPF